MTGLLVFWVGVVFGADRELVAQLDREVIALQQRVNQLERALATCATDEGAPVIYAELVQIYAGGPVKVVRDGVVTRVTMPVDLLLASDSFRIREEALPTLDLLATALKLHPDLKVEVVAHADGNEPSNLQSKLAPTAWELSTLRAVAIGRALAESYAVPGSRLTVAGQGNAVPVATNDTTEGRALNRRVEFVIRPGDVP